MPSRKSRIHSRELPKSGPQSKATKVPKALASSLKCFNQRNRFKSKAMCHGTRCAPHGVFQSTQLLRNQNQPICQSSRISEVMVLSKCGSAKTSIFFVTISESMIPFLKFCSKPQAWLRAEQGPTRKQPFEVSMGRPSSLLNRTKRSLPRNTQRKKVTELRHKSTASVVSPTAGAYT